MKASQLLETAIFSIKNRFPLLVKGPPGVGKSSIIEQASESMGVKLILNHPVVSDPTDYKGLPFPSEDGKSARFLPFGDLLSLVNAKGPTVFFMDDIGQAPSSVQSSLMHLLLARRVNGHKISDYVTFMAATNRRQDRAAVQGILEPVKSRFKSIVELEVDLEEWIAWAIKNNMPTELNAFIRFRPNHLYDFNPTMDIINTPNPRTVANVGDLMNAGMSTDIRRELIEGAAGKGFAAEFMEFLMIYKDLPDINELIERPKVAKVFDSPDMLYAVCGALSAKADKKNFNNILIYTDRLPGEFQVLLVKDAVKRNVSLANTGGFKKWAIRNSDVIL